MCVWTVCNVKNVELNLEQNVVLESFVDLRDYWSIRRWFGMQRSACKMPVKSPKCGFDCKDRPDRPVGSPECGFGCKDRPVRSVQGCFGQKDWPVGSPQGGFERKDRL